MFTFHLYKTIVRVESMEELEMKLHPLHQYLNSKSLQLTHRLIYISLLKTLIEGKNKLNKRRKINKLD